LRAVDAGLYLHGIDSETGALALVGGLLRESLRPSRVVGRREAGIALHIEEHIELAASCGEEGGAESGDVILGVGDAVGHALLLRAVDMFGLAGDGQQSDTRCVERTVFLGVAILDATGSGDAGEIAAPENGSGTV
jgi:hypothetical protein